MIMIFVSLNRFNNSILHERVMIDYYCTRIRRVSIKRYHDKYHTIIGK